MRKFIYKSVMLIATALIAVSCSTDDIDTYNEQENAIRFPGASGKDTYYSGYSSADGFYFATYSFIKNPMAESEVYQLPINIIGKVSDKERMVNFDVVVEDGTAPENSYEILGASIPAGECEGAIRIRIANTIDLKTTSYQLKIVLRESDDFKLGPKNYLTAVLTWNNILPAPTNSNLIRSYNLLVKSSVGNTNTSVKNYSTSAHMAIVEALGWNDWGNADVHGSQANAANFDNCYDYLPRWTWIYYNDFYKIYARELDAYLKAYEAEHGEPLLHDGGGMIGQPVEARQY